MTGRHLAVAAFWTSAAVVAHQYVAFPLAVAARGFLRRRVVQRGTARPRVSFIITAHDEERLIVDKLENTLAAEYPSDRIEIIVASDGSTDRTTELASSLDAPSVRILDLPRRGKNATMTDAALAASGEILIFNDADTAITRNAIRVLVAPFADPAVGAVAGERRHRPRDASDRLTRLQDRLRRHFQQLLSDGGSITTTGLLYAIRREHFRRVPSDVVDDLYIPMQAILAGRRLVFEPEAATYPISSPRKVRHPFARTVRMNVQHVRSYRPLGALFNPLDYGFFSVQLFTQKVLRRFLGIPLGIMLLSGMALRRDAPVYRIVTRMHLGFHGLAIAGFLADAAGRVSLPILRHAMLYDREQLAGLAALGAAFTSPASDRWDSHAEPAPSPGPGDRNSASPPIHG